MNTKFKALTTLATHEYDSSNIMILPQLNFDIWKMDGDYCISFGWIIFYFEFWFGNLKNLI